MKKKKRIEYTPFWATLGLYIRPFKKEMAIAIICSALTGASISLMNVVVKWIVDYGALRMEANGSLSAPEVRFRYVFLFVGLYIFVSISRITLWATGYRFVIRSIEEMLCRLRGKFFRHVQDLCFRFHDDVSSGELFNYIMGSPVKSLKEFLFQSIMMVPEHSVTFLLSIFILARFNWQMSIITIITITTVILINRKSRIIMREISTDFMKTESAVSKYVADMLRGSRSVKIYSMESTVENHFDTQINLVKNKGISQAWRNHMERIKPEMVSYLGLASIYIFGSFFTIYGDMTIGTFFVFVASYNSLMHTILAMLNLNLIRANAEAGLDRIEKILNVKKTTPEAEPSKRKDVRWELRRARELGLPTFQFKNMSFQYKENSPVFNNFSCTIPQGQSVALVGPSGSGKTSIVSLLLRLYDIQEGAILFNGTDIRDYALRELRSSFGVVPQDPYIFQGTIRDNIRITKPDADDEEVKKAMEIALADEFVERLPDGIDTVLGEGGFSLSGGQRQRLAIARAVIGKPLFFIFDEATSALDNQSELKIQEAMDKIVENHTTLIIAHRLSTIKNVDRILVLDNGRIIQDGNYEELSERKGLFRNLLNNVRDGYMK